MHKWILEAGLERCLVKMGWTMFESFGTMIRLVSVLDVWYWLTILCDLTLTRHTQGIESWDQRAVDTRPKESSVEASGQLGVSTSYCLFFCCVSWSDDIESVWAWRRYWDGQILVLWPRKQTSSSSISRPNLMFLYLALRETCHDPSKPITSLVCLYRLLVSGSVLSTMVGSCHHKFQLLSRKGSCLIAGLFDRHPSKGCGFSPRGCYHRLLSSFYLVWGS